MKTENLRKLLIATAVLFSLAASSQTVEFTYDQAGNRITRDVIYLQPMQTTDSSTVEKNKDYDEMLGNSKITISPNPNGGRFSVKIEGIDPDNPPQIYLHSIKGTLIYENTKAALVNEIDISRHPKGTYILSLIVAGKRKTWKIIKQ
ncbi:MAG: T9SS type A sorting domain-containing protein [Chlorobi bacterium]|nr:T9SS type A sorting domain-containing protein [Chlorobiota bacterium]